MQKPNNSDWHVSTQQAGRRFPTTQKDVSSNERNSRSLDCLHSTEWTRTIWNGRRRYEVLLSSAYEHNDDGTSYS